MAMSINLSNKLHHVTPKSRKEKKNPILLKINFKKIPGKHIKEIIKETY